MEGKKNQFFVDGKQLSEAALKRKHELESDPSSRTDCMAGNGPDRSDNPQYCHKRDE